MKHYTAERDPKTGLGRVISRPGRKAGDAKKVQTSLAAKVAKSTRYRPKR